MSDELIKKMAEVKTEDSPSPVAAPAAASASPAKDPVSPPKATETPTKAVTTPTPAEPASTPAAPAVTTEQTEVVDKEPNAGRQITTFFVCKQKQTDQHTMIICQYEQRQPQRTRRCSRSCCARDSRKCNRTRSRSSARIPTRRCTR